MTNIQDRNLFYELVVPSRKGWGERIVKELRHGHTTVLRMDNQQGSTVQHRSSAQCYAVAWMGREFGGQWVHVYVWLSPSDVHLELSHHWYLAILQYKIKSKKKKKKKEKKSGLN